MSNLAKSVAAMVVVVTAVLLLIGCATTSPSDTRSQAVVRVKHCLVEVAHVDPGPINDRIDDRMEAGLQEYFAEFGRSDVMGMGRDMSSREVRHDAIRALLLNCWKQGKLPVDDPLAKRPFRPIQF